MFKRIIIFLLVLQFCLATTIADARNITLQNHYVDGKNVLIQEVLTQENMTYIINRHFDLAGAVIILPEGSVLEFKKRGSLSNGILIGKNSSVKSSADKVIFSNLTVLGEWNVVDIYSEWFQFCDDPEINARNFRSMCMLTDDYHQGIIHISEGVYKIKLDEKNQFCFGLNSNTELILHGNVMLEPNDLEDYQMVQVKNKNNVKIHGSGSLIGDVETHTGIKGEWGMGVEVLSSDNVQVKDLTIKNCWGDCVYIGQSEYKRESYSRNVIIDNVICQAGRRQGLSIIAGQNIYVKKCKLIDTGLIKFTAPGAGIDIEPNLQGKTIVDNVVIDSCIFYGNKDNKDFMTYNLDSTSNIYLKNCQMEGNILLGKNSYNIIVDSCDIREIISNEDLVDNIIIKNSIIQKRIKNSIDRNNIKFENCKQVEPSVMSLRIVIPFGGLMVLSAFGIKNVYQKHKKFALSSSCLFKHRVQ